MKRGEKTEISYAAPMTFETRHASGLVTRNPELGTSQLGDWEHHVQSRPTSNYEAGCKRTSNGGFWIASIMFIYTTTRMQCHPEFPP